MGERLIYDREGHAGGPYDPDRIVWVPQAQEVIPEAGFFSIKDYFHVNIYPSLYSQFWIQNP